jgi:ethanolamine utilization protein EutJ
MFEMDRVEQLIAQVESSLEIPRNYKGELYVGIDLGTAYVVILAVDSCGNPVTGAYRFAQVVKDGVVVDFAGATKLLRELKREIEEKVGAELVKGAGAYPPDTGRSTVKSHFYICEGAGFEVINMIDEPTAANNVLNIENGAIVDVGGGTTGIAVVQNGEVVYTADEPTGGTHFSLVIAGAKKISFEEAEEYKKRSENQKEVLTLVKPVIQKVASIIKSHIKRFDVNAVYLVGGTCCLAGIETVIEKEIGISTFKPVSPMFVTPLGIALSCLGVRNGERRGVEVYY